MKKLLLLISIFIFTLLGTNNVFADSPPPNQFIKGSGSTIYYKASDGNRYVFPTEKVYKSWFIELKFATTVSDEELAKYPIGGNITYRPGYRMVKITTDPKVYVVDKGGVLRWVTSESIALAIYGSDWDKKIDDVPDAFFINYTIGEPINNISEINLLNIFSNTSSINDDKSILFDSPLPPQADTDFIGVIDVSDWQLIETSNFSILLPQSWEHTEQQGIDSIIGKFVDKVSLDELSYDYGAYTSFYDGETTSATVVTYTTIDDLKAQIISSRGFGHRRSINFENVTKNFSSLPQKNFFLGGVDITDKQQQQIVLAIFKTIKFIR